MQDISSQFDSSSTSKIRNPQIKIYIDWDLDGTYTDETNYLSLAEIERAINEPLGGITLAQFDFLLNNISNRYTPNSDSSITDYLKINRRGKLQFGFDDEYIDSGVGVSTNPEIKIASKEVDFHFFDNIQLLKDFKLSTGDDLYLDIKTDNYIWEILDQVFSGHFTVIGSFNTDETWDAGSAETQYIRGGDQALTFDVTDAGFDTGYTPSSAIDLSSYSDTDKFAMFVYVDDVENLAEFTIRLHNVVDDTFLDLDPDLETGWNQLWVDKQDFIGIDEDYPSNTWFIIGTSEIETGGEVIAPGQSGWDSIVKVEILATAETGETVEVIVDEMRMCEVANYPRRYFDLGLQEIGVAFFGGNTAFYEIKSACESEGARFYADESGGYHFENRQFYNVNSEYKVSRYGFSFSELLDFEHPKPDTGTINSIKVRLEPRVIQAEKTIWTYSSTPSIGVDETKTIWASLTDPCPTDTDGIVSPVATTDYTANDNDDDSGTDRTTDVDVSITRFTDSVKIDVTNNHTSAVYLTSLKLRGTPAEKVDTVFVRSSDATSISTYGEIPSGGYEISSKYLTDEDYAQTLADQLLEWYKDPLDRVEIKIRALPQLQIGDMIAVENSETDSSLLIRITGIKLQMSLEEGLIQTLTGRSVSDFETLTFFEIASSEIGSTDVIST